MGNMLRYLFLRNKLILITLLGLVVILVSSSQSYANNTENSSFSNLELSVSIRNNQLTINQANVFAMRGMYLDNDIDSTKIIIKSGKNPKTCFMIAFFPGFFIHGLGHYYIGKYKTGTILLGTEVLSISSFLIGAFMGVTQMDSHNKSDTPDVLGGIGLGLFFGSWMYDWIGAPKKAKRMQQNQTYMIYPSIEDKRISMNLAFNWKL